MLLGPRVMTRPVLERCQQATAPSVGRAWEPLTVACSPCGNFSPWAPHLGHTSSGLCGCLHTQGPLRLRVLSPEWKSRVCRGGPGGLANQENLAVLRTAPTAEPAHTPHPTETPRLSLLPLPALQSRRGLWCGPADGALSGTSARLGLGVDMAWLPCLSCFGLLVF